MSERLLLLPQKPYLPLESLKEALEYPHEQKYTDEQIQTVLEQCYLEKFVPQIHQIANWSQTLSLGE